MSTPTLVVKNFQKGPLERCSKNPSVKMTPAAKGTVIRKYRFKYKTGMLILFLKVQNCKSQFAEMESKRLTFCPIL
jgi:hypothetical protein